MLFKILAFQNIYLTFILWAKETYFKNIKETQTFEQFT